MGFSGLRPSDCSPQLARLGALGALGYPPPAVPSPARGTNLRRFPGHAVTTSASRLGEPYSCSCSTLYPFRSSPDDSRLTTPSRPSTPLRNPRGHIKDSSDLPKAHGTLIPPIILFHRPFFSPPPHLSQLHRPVCLVSCSPSEQNALRITRREYDVSLSGKHFSPGLPRCTTAINSAGPD